MAAAGTILVVDADADTRRLLGRLLEMEGYTVVTADGADQAMDALAASNPDLVLLDIMMPSLDGATLCRRLKADRASQALPVILMTALPLPEETWIASGAEAVVRKPFNRPVLLSWVRRLVRARQANARTGGVETVLVSVAAAIEARSVHGEDHLWRVARYSELLASAAGLDEQATAAIRKGALLHDIGMIGVPDAILRQPRTLTPDEFEHIKRHTVLGARICRAIPDGADVAAIVRGHHERWQGEGYPDSLAGPEIPLGARIVAVADAYDALTSYRPYRRALSAAEALEVLWFGADAQWDPHLIELFDAIARSAEEARGGETRRDVNRTLLKYQILESCR